MQALQAQRLARSGLVDDERRDAALREPARQADAVFHLLRRIEAIELDEDRRAALDAFGADIERGQMRFAVGNFDALAVLVRETHAAIEEGPQALVEIEAPRRVVRLQALGRQIVGRRAPVLVAGRNQPAASFVLFGKRAELVAHFRPGLAEGGRSGGVGLLGGLLQRRAHLLDLADLGAHLDREIDREVPDVVGREVPEHRRYPPIPFRDCAPARRVPALVLQKAMDVLLSTSNSSGCCTMKIDC